MDSLYQDPHNFNPQIIIDNKGEGIGEEGQASKPKIRRLIKRGESDEVPWLTKEYQFRGTLQCPRVSATRFPFDLHRLPIKVKSVPMPGLTTVGLPRRVRLVDPVLRRAEALAALERGG